MKDIIKFGILFLLCSLVFSSFLTYMTSVFNLFGAGLDYVVNSNIAVALSSIIAFISWFFDTLFLNTTTTLITTYGGFAIDISWIITVVRVIFAFSVFALILSLIVNRG